jgi:hypothetical protein
MQYPAGTLAPAASVHPAACVQQVERSRPGWKCAPSKTRQKHSSSRVHELAPPGCSGEDVGGRFAAARCTPTGGGELVPAHEITSSIEHQDQGFMASPIDGSIRGSAVFRRSGIRRTRHRHDLRRPSRAGRGASACCAWSGADLYEVSSQEALNGDFRSPGSSSAQYARGVTVCRFSPTALTTGVQSYDAKSWLNTTAMPTSMF